MAVRGTASRAGRSPKALGSRRSGRLGEPPGASGSLADAPHRPRLPSCPAARPRDLYGSIIRTFGMTGFGTFTVSKRGARKGRNPRTGEAIKIKASKSVRFKAGRTLKNSV